MKLPAPQFQIRRPKNKVIIIVLITLVVLAVATYAVFSVLNWNSLQKRSDEASVALKAKIDSTLGAEKPSGTVSSQLSTIITDFEGENGANPCASPSLFSWQTVIPAVKTIQTKCEQQLSTAESVIASFKLLETYLDNQQKIATTLSEQVTSTKDMTDYAAASSSWKAFSTLKTLPQSDDVTPITDLITTSSLQISAAFDNLVEADKNEDKAAFDTAVSDLQKAYASLSAVSDAAKAKQTELVNATVAAYEKL